jgi:hypothetical protein
LVSSVLFCFLEAMKFLSFSIIINYNNHPLINNVLSLQILAEGNLDHQDVQSLDHLQIDPYQENTQANIERLQGKPHSNKETS